MKIISKSYNLMLLKKHPMLKQLIFIGTIQIELVLLGKVQIFSDPYNDRRTVNHISWYADGARKFAASYCNLEFQSNTSDSFIDSYIWDIGK